MTDYEEHLKKDARLIILRELALQTDGRLNENILVSVLDTFGHHRSRDWLRTQLRALADLDAIKIHEAGSVMVAEITASGQDHVDRRSVIEGVAHPSPKG